MIVKLEREVEREKELKLFLKSLKEAVMIIWTAGS